MDPKQKEKSAFILYLLFGGLLSLWPTAYAIFLAPANIDLGGIIFIFAQIAMGPIFLFIGHQKLKNNSIGLKYNFLLVIFSILISFSFYLIALVAFIYQMKFLTLV